jgi:hypothetical protein
MQVRLSLIRRGFHREPLAHGQRYRDGMLGRASGTRNRDGVTASRSIVPGTYSSASRLQHATTRHQKQQAAAQEFSALGRRDRYHTQQHAGQQQPGCTQRTRPVATRARRQKGTLRCGRDRECSCFWFGVRSDRSGAKGARGHGGQFAAGEANRAGVGTLRRYRNVKYGRLSWAYGGSR